MPVKTPYQWPCKYEQNYDGDTLTLTLDFGFRQYKMVKVRLDGIDTAELRRVKEIPPEEEAVFKAYASLAKEAVAKYFEQYEDRRFVYYSHHVEGDSFGRSVGDVKVSHDDYTDTLTDYLLDRRLAITYDGKESRSSEEFLNRHRKNITWLRRNGLLEDE